MADESISFRGYVFRAAPKGKRVGPSGKLLGYPNVKIDRFRAVDITGHAEAGAKFRGALLRLFGPPRHTSSLADEAFSYLIEAIDIDGYSWQLEAYEGASGSAIGGRLWDPTIMPVALALLELIDITPTADFEAVTYDEDTGSTITYGCQNGDCYYREVREESYEQPDDEVAGL